MLATHPADFRHIRCQCRLRTDGAFQGICSGSTLFAQAIGPRVFGNCGNSNKYSNFLLSAEIFMSYIANVFALNMLCANSADKKLTIFFFFPRN